MPTITSYTTKCDLTASAGTTLTGRGTSNVLSYRYATSPIRAIPDTPQPKLLLSRAIVL
jgi:hypothetical protein